MAQCPFRYARQAKNIQGAVQYSCRSHKGAKGTIRESYVTSLQKRLIKLPGRKGAHLCVVEKEDLLPITEWFNNPQFLEYSLNMHRFRKGPNGRSGSDKKSHAR
jgi:hypothetical protein